VAVIPIRTYGDPVLRRPAKPVRPDEFGEHLDRLIDDMLETMYDAPGVGLAAPQVGVEKQLFVFDVGEGPGVVINPVVVRKEGTWVYHEGCLSVPGLWFDIERPAYVVVEGLDRKGNKQILEGDGLMGRMLLHETDHLKGRLLIDQLDRERRKQALRELRERILR